MSRKRKSEDEELVTVKVKKRVKNAILEIQGLLQFRDHKRYSHSDIIEYALSHVPELEIPLNERLKIIQKKKAS